MKPTWIDVNEIAKYYDSLMREVPYPKIPQKPIKQDYPTNKAFGEALDSYELEKESRRNLVRDYRNTQARITSMFKESLLQYLEIDKHPKAEKLWEMAWNSVHSEGLLKVAYYAEEFAELMK